MSEHRRAWLAAGIALVVTGSGLVLAFLPGGVPLGHKFALAAIGASLALSYSIVGAIVASRRPENAIGWLFLVASGLWAITVLAAGYATFAVSHGTTNSQLAIRADWLQAWLYAPALFVAILPMFLLFPDGRPLTPRWRPLVALAFVAIVTGAFLEATMPASVRGERRRDRVHHREPVRGVDAAVVGVGAERDRGRWPGDRAGGRARLARPPVPSLAR